MRYLVVNDGYSDNDKEFNVNVRRGVDGVMTPNHLSEKDLDKYVKDRSGEVKIIREGNK